MSPPARCHAELDQPLLRTPAGCLGGRLVRHRSRRTHEGRRRRTQPDLLPRQPSPAPTPTTGGSIPISTAPTGNPGDRSRCSFIVVDSDGDGFPDEYELAHTAPPSATALNPDDDLEHDGAGDGLTNWQEYLLGTDPNDPDSDDDSSRTAPRSPARVRARRPIRHRPTPTATALDDLVETNTGIWVERRRHRHQSHPGRHRRRRTAATRSKPTPASSSSATDTGTNPLECQQRRRQRRRTGMRSPASLHRPQRRQRPAEHPLSAARPGRLRPAPPTSRSRSTSCPASRTWSASARSRGTGPGTLETIAKRRTSSPISSMTSPADWTIRNDVLYRGVISAIGNGPLQPDTAPAPRCSAPNSASATSWATTTTSRSCSSRPPSATAASAGTACRRAACVSKNGGNTYAGYGEYADAWPTGDGEPAPFVWYAGKQYDDYFLDEADMGAPDWASGTCPTRRTARSATTGWSTSASRHTPPARRMSRVSVRSWTTYWNVYSIFNAVDILDNFATEYPQWARRPGLRDRRLRLVAGPQGPRQPGPRNPLRTEPGQSDRLAARLLREPLPRQGRDQRALRARHARPDGAGQHGSG